MDFISEAEETLNDDLKDLGIDITAMKKTAEESLAEKVETMIADSKKIIERLDEAGGLSDSNVKEFRKNYVHLQTMQVHFKFNQKGCAECIRFFKLKADDAI